MPKDDRNNPRKDQGPRPLDGLLGQAGRSGHRRRGPGGEAALAQDIRELGGDRGYHGGNSRLLEGDDTCRCLPDCAGDRSQNRFRACDPHRYRRLPQPRQARFVLRPDAAQPPVGGLDLLGDGIAPRQQEAEEPARILVQPPHPDRGEMGRLLCQVPRAGHAARQGSQGAGAKEAEGHLRGHVGQGALRRLVEALRADWSPPAEWPGVSMPRFSRADAIFLVDKTIGTPPFLVALECGSAPPRGNGAVGDSSPCRRASSRCSGSRGALERPRTSSAPAASIDRISSTVSRGTVISPVLPGRARQSCRPGNRMTRVAPLAPGHGPLDQTAQLFVTTVLRMCLVKPDFRF